MSVILNKHFVYINSRERLAGTDSNFTYNIAFPPDRKFTHVVCLDALIPKSYYLVQDGFNFFQLQEGNTIVTITVPIGSYTLQTWINQVTSLLTTNSPNSWIYTVTYPAITSSILPDIGKLTYTVSGNTSQPSFIFDSHCVLFEQFGFFRNTTNTFVGNTLISTCVIKLQSEDRLVIHSNCVANPNNDDILVSINSTTSINYSSISYVCVAPEYNSKVLNSQNNNTYSFQLTDENGNEQNLNGLNLNMTVVFFKLANIYELIQNIMRLSLPDQKLIEEKPN